MQKLTPHFTLREFVKLGVDPKPDQLDNLLSLATELEIVRRAFGDGPIRITSGLRTPARNRSVGGVGNSAHLDGLAADFVIEAVSPAETVHEMQMRPSLHQFDQLILYRTHVHISVDPRMRQQVINSQ